MEQDVKAALLSKLTLADVEELVRDKWQHEAPKEFDINRPPQAPYVHQEFPKLMYDHQKGYVMTVRDKKQEVAAAKEGFKAEPSPDFDYTMVRNGKAPSIHEASTMRERAERGSVVPVEVIGQRESS